MPTRPAKAKPKPAPSTPPGERRKVGAVCGFLLVVIALIYGQTLSHKFLNFDDNAFVFKNPHVTAGLTPEGTWWAFTNGPVGEWYPLAMLSHQLDCELFELRPGRHHITSVLLHAAAAILLFLVWRRMTAQRAVPGTDRRLVVAQVSGVRADEGGPERDNIWPSALVATIFAVHPQHVESVAWIAERRDVLSGMFFALTLATYWEYVRSGRKPSRYLLLLAMYSLALMSKPMVVTLPAVLLLLDYWPLRRIGQATDPALREPPPEQIGVWSLILEKMPLVALAVGDCVLTLRTHNAGGTPVAWSVRLGNATVSCVEYIAQFFYPVGLSPIYPLPPGGQPGAKVAGACAILVLVTAAAILGRRRFPYVFVGWFWFVGMLVPVLGLVHVSTHAMADRYTYLPSIGLAIALAFGGARVAARSLAWRRGMIACAVVVVALLSVCAFRQTTFWYDDQTLWQQAVACDPANGEAQFGLAFALQREGRRDEAIAHYRLAGEHPIDSSAFINLGLLLAQEGKLDEAIVEYRRALEFDSTGPLSVQARNHLAGALIDKGQLDEAIALYDKAGEHAGDPSPFISVGTLLVQKGKLDEAITEFCHALKLDSTSPQSVQARAYLAEALLDKGQFEEAQRLLDHAAAIDAQSLAARRGHARLNLERALQANPSDVTSRCLLAEILFNSDRPARAIAELEKALAIKPKLVQPRVTLALALMKEGRKQEAIEQFRKALAIDPKNEIARQNLDALLRPGQ